MEFMAVDQVLDHAIEEEERAARAYRELAGRTESVELQQLLLGLAAQEEAHRESLERVRAGDLSVFAKPEFDAGLSAPSSDLELGPDVSPARALLAAIAGEQHSHLVYSSLARLAEDPGVRTVLEALAREEASHWRLLEKAYDELVGG